MSCVHYVITYLSFDSLLCRSWALNLFLSNCQSHFSLDTSESTLTETDFKAGFVIKDNKNCTSHALEPKANYPWWLRYLQIYAFVSVSLSPGIREPERTKCTPKINKFRCACVERMEACNMFFYMRQTCTKHVVFMFHVQIVVFWPPTLYVRRVTSRFCLRFESSLEIFTWFFVLKDFSSVIFWEPRKIN